MSWHAAMGAVRDHRRPRVDLLTRLAQPSGIEPSMPSARRIEPDQVIAVVPARPSELLQDEDERKRREGRNSTECGTSGLEKSLTSSNEHHKPAECQKVDHRPKVSRAGPH